MDIMRLCTAVCRLTATISRHLCADFQTMLNHAARISRMFGNAALVVGDEHGFAIMWKRLSNIQESSTSKERRANIAQQRANIERSLGKLKKLCMRLKASFPCHSVVTGPCHSVRMGPPR